MLLMALTQLQNEIESLPLSVFRLILQIQSAVKNLTLNQTITRGP